MVCRGRKKKKNRARGMMTWVASGRRGEGGEGSRGGPADPVLTCILLMTFHPSSTPKMGMYLDSLGNSSWSNTSSVPFSYRMACRVIVCRRRRRRAYSFSIASAVGTSPGNAN